MSMAINKYSIGCRVRKLRLSAGLTQAELAEFSELSVQYISFIETGRKAVSLESAVKIAAVFRVSLDHLVLGGYSVCSSENDEDILKLIADCSLYEKNVIYDVAAEVKNSLRENKPLINK